MEQVIRGTFNVKYKRTHIPTGNFEIKEFHDTTLIPYYSSIVKNERRYWVGECEHLINQWNKMGIVDGKPMWVYELVVIY